MKLRGVLLGRRWSPADCQDCWSFLQGRHPHTALAIFRSYAIVFTQTSCFCFPKHLQLVHLYLLVFRNPCDFTGVPPRFSYLEIPTPSSTHLLEISSLPPTFDISLTFKHLEKTVLLGKRGKKKGENNR